MADYNKPFYKSVKGSSFRWWNVPFCPHCKRQLGLIVKDEKPDECPMCHKPLDWGDEQ